MKQNPPSIPTLPLAQAVCWLRNSNLIIDWHNLGHSILALKLGSQHPLVILAKRLILFTIFYKPSHTIFNRTEMIFGRSAHTHLFVTSAMRDYLTAHWHLQFSL